MRPGITNKFSPGMLLDVGILSDWGLEAMQQIMIYRGVCNYEGPRVGSEHQYADV